MDECKTIFDPHRHGWPFANVYPYRLGIGRIRIPPAIEMGFCGGMVFSALDRFYEREPMPETGPAPVQGEPLFDALFRRQRQTLNGGVMLKTWRWQIKSDEELAALTTHEWATVRQSIDAGHPIVICLIRAEGWFGKVWENHQVVVCGYRQDPASGRVTLSIYDPNWRNTPGVTIQFTPRLPGLQAVRAQRRRAAAHARLLRHPLRPRQPRASAGQLIIRRRKKRSVTRSGRSVRKVEQRTCTSPMRRTIWTLRL